MFTQESKETSPEREFIIGLLGGSEYAPAMKDVLFLKSAINLPFVIPWVVENASTLINRNPLVLAWLLHN